MCVTLRAVSRLLDFHWQKCESREGSGVLRLMDVTQEVSPKVSWVVVQPSMFLVHIFPGFCMFLVMLDRGPFSFVKDVSLVFLFGCYKSTRSLLVGGDCAGFWHGICVGWNISDETHTAPVLLTSASDRLYHLRVHSWPSLCNRGDILHPKDSGKSDTVSNISVLLTSFRCVSDVENHKLTSSLQKENCSKEQQPSSGLCHEKTLYFEVIALGNGFLRSAPNSLMIIYLFTTQKIKQIRERIWLNHITLGSRMVLVPLAEVLLMQTRIGWGSCFCWIHVAAPARVGNRRVTHCCRGTATDDRTIFTWDQNMRHQKKKVAQEWI